MSNTPPSDYAGYMRWVQERKAAQSSASSRPTVRYNAWLSLLPRIDSQLDSQRIEAIALMPDHDLPDDAAFYGAPTMYGDVPTFQGADKVRLWWISRQATAAEAVALGMMPPELVYLPQDTYMLVSNPAGLLKQRAEFFARARSPEVAGPIREAESARTWGAINTGQSVQWEDRLYVETTFTTVRRAVDLQLIPRPRIDVEVTWGYRKSRA